MPRLVDQWQEGEVTTSLFKEAEGYSLLENHLGIHHDVVDLIDPVELALARRIDALKGDDHG